jgi:hypothetical protein
MPAVPRYATARTPSRLPDTLPPRALTPRRRNERDLRDTDPREQFFESPDWEASSAPSALETRSTWPTSGTRKDVALFAGANALGWALIALTDSAPLISAGLAGVVVLFVNLVLDSMDVTWAGLGRRIWPSVIFGLPRKSAGA